MSGETRVKYGDVILRRVMTQGITQTPVMDPSDTDLMYWKFSVRVSGIVHGKTGWCEWVDAPSRPFATNSPSTDALISTRVSLPPRHIFEMRVSDSGTGDGVVILEGRPFPDQDSPPDSISLYDVNHGPRCTEFKVSKIVGGDIYHVDAEFEVCKVECDVYGNAGGNTKGILSNRWSAVDSLDVNRRLTRTYQGTLLLASAKYDAKMFRAIVVPPIQARMQRENLTFFVTEDGKSLRWTCTDVQISQAAPRPATFWEIEQTSTASLARVCERQVSGVLICDDDRHNAAELVALAYYIISAKIYNAVPSDVQNKANIAIPDAISITEHIGSQTKVSFSAHYKVMDAAGFENGWFNKIVGTIGLPLETILLTDPANPSWNKYKSYNVFRSDGCREAVDADGNIVVDGSGDSVITSPPYEGAVSLLSLFTPYLQTPCDDVHATVPSATQSLGSDRNESTKNGPSSSYNAFMVTDLPSESNYLTAKAKANAYTHFKMSSTIKRKTMRAAMPIARAGASSPSPGVAPPDATRFVKLGQDQSRRVVRIEAQRVGEWPQMPDLDSLSGFSSSDSGRGYPGPTQKLLVSRQLYATPEVSVTGQKIYTVGIEAVYGFTRCPGAMEFIPVGNQIWNSDGEIKTNTIATADTAWSPS